MEYIVQEHSGTAIQEAIDKAANSGGGKIVLTPGIYESGTIYLRSNIELHLQAGAKIVGFTDYKCYDDFRDPELDAVAPEESRKCLIAAKREENISITGSGEINGSGMRFFKELNEAGTYYKKPSFPRPRMVQLFKCSNVVISGVSFIDSPCWTFWLNHCEDVRIHNIRISGHKQMINNDGIDIDCCRRVTISDSLFNTADDCLILRAIRLNPAESAVCEQIVVSNCILNTTTQGVRIGCPSDDTIKHCSFSNLVFRGNNGVNCESPHRYLRMNCQGYLNVHDIRFQNCDMHCEGFPIRIYVEDGIKIRRIANIFFKDISLKSKRPILLSGTAETALENIVLQNISGEIGDNTPLITKYLKNLQLKDCNLSAITDEEVPFKRVESDSWETTF